MFSKSGVYMNNDKMSQLAELILDAWNSQDVERVVACYTVDMIYLDPNLQDAVRGSQDFRRYLSKLFATWQMNWKLKEAFLFEGGNGCTVMWHATIQKPGSDKMVDFDGMDLVKVRNGLVERNEVYFDRVVLLPLMEAGGS
jgi:ketosteroid isomerase-like protein